MRSHHPGDLELDQLEPKPSSADNEQRLEDDIHGRQDHFVLGKQFKQQLATEFNVHPQGIPADQHG